MVFHSLSLHVFLDDCIQKGNYQDLKQYLPIIYLAIGWIFGMAGSIFYYWFERFRKRRDFKNGLKSELKGNLKRMVITVSNLKRKLGKVDHEHLNWVNNSLLKIHSQEEIDKLHPWLKDFLNLTPDKLIETLDTGKIFEPEMGLGLNKFNLVFLENHLDRILLLDIDSQKRLYNIKFRIDVTNQAVDRYSFFFDKPYEPGISEENRKNLHESIANIYEAKSKNLYIVANDFIALLEKL